MIVDRYKSELMASNMYIVQERGHALVIDPFSETSLAKGLIIDMIVLTHEHYDHISGVNAWKELTGASVLCSKKCDVNLRNTKKNMSRYFREFCELQSMKSTDNIQQNVSEYTCNADLTFDDKYEFTWEKHRVSLFEIPGHSQGSIGIFVDDNCFFSGDSLIPGQNVELRFPGGSRADWEKIGRGLIEAIPKGVTVYPGHYDFFVIK